MIGNRDLSQHQNSQNDNANGSYSIVNIVFNYFNESPEAAQESEEI